MSSLDGKGHRIELVGEYDLSRKDEIAELFNSLDGDGALVIDLTNVTYLDSTVLHELATLRLRSADRPITLEGVSEHLRRVFMVVNFDQIFEIVD